MQSDQKLTWRSPEEIVEIGFQRAPVVMMNEAHSGWKRCIRTRQIGKRILSVAHKAGVRYLAMEALFPDFANFSNQTRQLMNGDFGYLSQPEMKEFMQAALDLGWTLIPYEADNFKWISEKHGLDISSDSEAEKRSWFQDFQAEFTSLEFTNWREKQQALNLIRVLQSLPANTSLLVWCGNSHHSKESLEGWFPMGYQFKKQGRIDPFVIDQIRTVNFDQNPFRLELLQEFSDELHKRGGTAGFLSEEAPDWLRDSPSEDAFLLSVQNDLA
jgi:hypothetical protein